MSHSPFFTIITPTYNRAHFLASTIQSVLGQQFQDWEYIIVDDGSTDATKEVVKSYPDSRIRYVYQENQERSAARNRGISEAKGKYICFLDSDDTYLPHHLIALYKTIETEGFPVGVFATRVQYIAENEVVKESPVWDQVCHPVLFVWKHFLLMNAVCLHRDCLREHRFPEAFSVWEDTHLWLRIVAQYPFFQIPDCTVTYVLHSEGTVQQSLGEVSMEKVVAYLDAIKHLFSNHHSLLAPWITLAMRRDYEHQKLLLFQGMATRNGQKKEAWVLLKKAMKKKINLGLLLLYARRVSRLLYL